MIKTNKKKKKKLTLIYKKYFLDKSQVSYLEWYVISVAAAIAALSMRLNVGVAASVAANAFARPEFVTTYRTQQCFT